MNKEKNNDFNSQQPNNDSSEFSNQNLDNIDYKDDFDNSNKSSNNLDSDAQNNTKNNTTDNNDNTSFDNNNSPNASFINNGVNSVNNNDNFIDNTDNNPQNNSTNNKKFPTKIVACVAVAAVVVIAAIFVFMNMKSKIDLNKYVNVKFQGVNGYGKAVAEIDWDKLKKEDGSKIKLKSHSGTVKELMEDPVLILETCVNIEFENNENLKNGDEVTYKFNIIGGETALSFFDNEIKHEAKTIKVEGLKDVETIDIFKYVKLKYEGANKSARASIEYTGPDSNIISRYLRVDYDSNHDLENGNKVKVEFTYPPEDFATKYGKVPQEKEKLFVVENLPEYINYKDKIDDKYLETLTKEADELLKEKMSTLGDSISVKSVEKIGDFLFSPKPEYKYSAIKNGYGIIYKVTTEAKDSFDKEYNLTGYACVSFRDILKNTKNEYSYESTPRVNYGYQYLGFGYKDIDELKKFALGGTFDKNYDLQWNVK